MSADVLSRLLQYFPKNRAILVQKLGAEQNRQNPFPAILWLKKNKKKPMAYGKALMARPLRKELFFGFLNGARKKKYKCFYSNGPKTKRVQAPWTTNRFFFLSFH